MLPKSISIINIKFSLNFVNVLTLGCFAALSIPLSACSHINKGNLGVVGEKISDIGKRDPNKVSDYPALYNVPNIPKNMKTDKEWDMFEVDMKNQAETFQNSPKTTLSNVDTRWANSVAAKLPSFNGTATAQDMEAWAARVRASMDSSLKRK